MAWAVDSESRVLLVRQTAGLKFWTLPGGKVRPRESLQNALLREVFEETGLKGSGGTVDRNHGPAGSGNDHGSLCRDHSG